MKRFLAGSIASFLFATARAQAPEPAVEPNTLATAIFLVLFVGFCGGFVWMVWGDKDKKKGKGKTGRGGPRTNINSPREALHLPQEFRRPLRQPMIAQVAPRAPRVG